MDATMETAIAMDPTSLTPYGQLIKMLIPAASSISVLDARGQSLWSDGACEQAEVADQIVDWLRAGASTDATTPSVPGTRLDIDGISVFCFALRGGAHELLGVVALECAERGEVGHHLGTMFGLLRPTLEVLSRELRHQLDVDGLKTDLRRRDHDLEMLLGEGADSLESGDAEDFGRIVSVCIKQLHAAFGALVVPEKNLVICRTAPCTERRMASDLLTRSHRHLLALAQVRRRLTVLNRSVTTGPLANLAHKVLICPVLSNSGATIGTLLLFRAEQEQDFGIREIHLTELLGRRISGILVAAYDATGLLTRTALERKSAALLTGMKGGDQHHVIYVDADRLHVINEMFGMHIGDQLLVKLAELLRGCASEQVFVSRISGDRFAVLLCNADLDTATAMAERLCKAVADLGFVIGSKVADFTASFGVAPVLCGERPLSHALATAEAACKAAKDRGRGRVEVFQDADHSIIRRVENVALIGTIREALEHDRFRMEAQPIVSLAAVERGLGNLAVANKFELLLRMTDQDGQPVSPDKFLTAAERYQLAPAIDRWVVSYVTDLVSSVVVQLQRVGASFAINLSGQSLGDEAFMEFLVKRLRACQLPPSMLSFEITETAAVSNIVRAETLMRKIREFGYEVALDDFGKGLSSLSYLKALPVSCVKIDGALVRDVATNSRSAAMVKAVVELARAMNLQTTAECIESEEIRSKVAELGVDYAQGYAIGRPRALEQVLNSLLTQSAGGFAERSAVPIRHAV